MCTQIYCNRRGDSPKNSAQESWIRRNSFWKNTFSVRPYHVVLHNPPAELLCIVTSVTLEVARAARRSAQNPLAPCFLLAFSRQGKHYASAKASLITPCNWSGPSVIRGVIRAEPIQSLSPESNARSDEVAYKRTNTPHGDTRATQRLLPACGCV